MKFEKVSYEQYKEDVRSDSISSRSEADTPTADWHIEICYRDLKLPKRATKNSAGYDFYAPYAFTLRPGDTIRVATGIRVYLDDDKFLMCAPRSSLGFKARIQLDNTIGIIDADYVNSSNEGHIMLKLTNDSKYGNTISVKAGDAIMQGIILQYFKVDDDDTTTSRDGGIGSTDEKEDQDE